MKRFFHPLPLCLSFFALPLHSAAMLQTDSQDHMPTLDPVDYTLSDVDMEHINQKNDIHNLQNIAPLQGKKQSLDPEDIWWQAVEEGNTAQVEKLLAHFDVDLNKVNKDGQTPLDIATKQKHKGLAKTLIKALIQEGHDPNKKDWRGKTLLHCACEYKMRIEELLKKGADVNLPDCDGNTALHCSLFPSLGEKGYSRVWVLVAEGWLRGKENGQTIPKGIYEIIVRYCAYTTYTQNRLDTIKKWRLYAIKTLLKKGANVNWATVNGATPLHIAAECGQTTACQLLIQYRAEVNRATTDGWTPLHNATYSGHTDTCQYLIKEAKADPNPISKDGRTPLYIAAKYGHTDICRFLIEKAKADPNQVNKIGATPLHAAAWFGHTETCQILIANGADVNTHYGGGITPLYIAAWAGRTETCQYLMKAGANPHKRIPFLFGLTALGIAKEMKNGEIIKLFQKSAGSTCPIFLDFLLGVGIGLLLSMPFLIKIGF